MGMIPQEAGGVDFLPLSRADLDRRGWEGCDFVIISGDAYVDHPSFGSALIGRWLEDLGWRVGLIPQPDWTDPEALRVLGRPGLAFLVTAGNIDSMVNAFTANRRRRREDLYSPGGRPGQRPERASIVYAALARRAYKGIPVILGGVEASLRRLAHYDYWTDSLRRSVLLDSKADLLLYGMAEKALAAVAERLGRGEPVREIRDVPGTVWRTGREGEVPEEALRLPPFEELTGGGTGDGGGEDGGAAGEGAPAGEAFCRHYVLREREADPVRGRPLAEKAAGQWVVQNPPSAPLSSEELDRIYELPYRREIHPRYQGEGVPAYREVRFSLVSSRGCLGSCSFCALHFHQGRFIQARSHNSLEREARRLIRDPAFKGYIHDVGGPTANFRVPACRRQAEKGACSQRGCLFPDPCPNLTLDHQDYLALLRRLRKLDGVKKVFIRSGIRFDYLLADRRKGAEFLEELCRHHVSGQLKTAPEHRSPAVLRHMRKPGPEVYDRFADSYRRVNRRLGKKQYLIPYFIASHPGSTLNDAIELAVYLKKSRFVPDQAQDFYPTPGTRSTCMYATGLVPETGEPVFIPRKGRDRRLQRALLQFNRPENRKLVKEALQKTGRTDLLGKGGLLPGRKGG